MKWRDVTLIGCLVLALLGAASYVVVERNAGAPRPVTPSAGPAEQDSPDSSTASVDPSASDGRFRPVAIGAGGFVTGISISQDGRTRLVRTDGGGAYRWDGDEWRLVVSAETLPADVVEPGLGLGVLAVAAAPSDSSVAYMAFADGVFRSSDGARTWTQVLSGVSTAPNDSFRTWGSRLAVDPTDPDVVYYGSQLDGLYLTDDGGDSWQRVPRTEVPAGLRVDPTDPASRGDVTRPTESSGRDAQVASAGVSAVAFDPRAPSQGRSRTVYAASYGSGIFRSDDDGASWTRVGPEALAAVGYLRVLDNGDLIATSHADPVDLTSPSTVWKLANGRWSTTGPSKAANWRALASDPTTPGRVALMAQGGQLALSADDGQTWTLPSRSQSSDDDVPWLAWALNTGLDFMSMGELTFDPVKEGRLWFTEGTGLWYADLGATPTDPEQVEWHSQSRGLEQLVPTDAAVLPGGTALLTAWDRPIFRSDDPRQYPSTYGPTSAFGSAWSIDYSGEDPEYVVASVASHQAPNDPRTSGFSDDGGRSWQPFPTLPLDSTDAVGTFGFGMVAVGAPGNVVWAPAYGKRPQYTLDGGETWTEVSLPGVSDYAAVDRQPYYVNRQVLTSEKTAPGTFYLFVDGTGTFRTTDGGRTWVQMSDDAATRGTDYAYGATLKASPTRAGELYLSPGRLPGPPTAPFLRSTDSGATWEPVSGMTGVTAFGFGRGARDSDDAAVYAAGVLDGEYGVYRSVDGAAMWTRLTVFPTGRTTNVVAIDGDVGSGRVVAALGGSGWVYADFP